MSKIKYSLFLLRLQSPLSLTYLYFAVSTLITVIVWWNAYDHYEFGYEFGNVAASLSSGKGFSNVFGTPSGPTSWCSPLIVGYYALLFKLFGIKSLVSYWIILFSRVIVLSVSFYLLCRLDYGQNKEKLQILYLPLFTFYSVFILTKEVNDRAFLVLFIALFLYFINRIIKRNFIRYPYLLYFLAISLSLINVSLAVGFVLFIGYKLFLFFNNKTNSYISLKHLIFSILVFLTMNTAWGIRNKIELGVFIPFKSNLWLEVYMSNVVDEDGLLRSSNFHLYHPSRNHAVRKKFASMGEIAFVKEHEKAAKDYIAKHPGAVAYKVFRRSINSFVFNVPTNDKKRARLSSFDQNDVNILINNRFVNNHSWVNLELSKQDFRQRLNQLGLSDPEPVFRDWLAARQELLDWTYLNPFIVLKGISKSLVPFVCLIICLCFSDIRRNKLFLMTLVLFLLCIGPYVLISHYERYQTFLILFFTIFIAIASLKLVPIIFKKNEITFTKET